jgi:hypothetical protein
MTKILSNLAPALIISSILAAGSNGLAQTSTNRPAMNPQGFANMDSQQMQQMAQQMMMNNIKEQLAITNNDEWNIIQPRLAKVINIRIQTLFSTGMGMMGGMRRGNAQDGGFRGFPGMRQSDPDMEALQKQLDSNASDSQINAAMTKLRNNRKAKAAELAKAQDDLRSVLSVRQEAILVSSGMLE